MMKPNRNRSTCLSNECVRSALGIGVLLGAAVFGACESPMNQGPTNRSSAKYADALVARAIMDGTYHGGALSVETQSEGVRELTRVDSAGPTSGQPGQAVTPAGTDMAASTQGGGTGHAALAAPGTASSELASKLNTAENVLNLSLQDSIARSLRNALTIKVEAYNPAIKEALIVQAEAAFDPILFGQSNWANTDQPSVSLSPSLTNGQTWQNQVGVKEKLVAGGTAQVFTGANYSALPANTAPFVSARSTYATNVGLALTQPLLRGFGEDVNKADIYLAQRDRQISLSQFRQQVIKTVIDVETAYYQLMLAKANVSVQEWLLQQTLDTQHKIMMRIDVDADKITISQVEAAMESRNADLIRARTTMRNASDQLKNAINDPDLDIRQNALINPTDKPISEPLVFNLGEQIDLALRQRPELKQGRLQIERADIILKVAKNALLPKADVTLSVQTNGLDTSLDSAFAKQFSPADFWSYAAGMNLEIPLGNRAAESNLRETQLQRERVIMQLVQAAQSIVLDVKLNLRDVLTSYQEIQARVRSRVAAANQLEAFIQREKIVPLTPDFLNLKLQAQQTLEQAELAEIASVIGYNLAITKLEQAKGTLLEYNRIAIDQPPPAKRDEDFGKIRFLGHTYTVK